MNFYDVLCEEAKKLDESKVKNKKRANTPTLPENYTNAINRYRAMPVITKITDMKIFRY